MHRRFFGLCQRHSDIDTVDGFVHVFVTGFVTGIVDFLACVKGIQTSTQSMDSYMYS